MLARITALGGYELAIPDGDLLARKLAHGEPYEHGLLRLARRTARGGHVVDVGVNIGNHAVYLARAGCRVTAFEPNPDALSFLQSNISSNGLTARIDVHEVGLWSGREHGKVVGSPDSNLGGASIAPGNHGTATIDLVPLDVYEFAPDLIKIDVEGAEFEVLQGAWETIRRSRPIIIIELHQGREKAERLLRTLGYRRVGGSWADSPTFVFAARPRHLLIAGAVAARRHPRRALGQVGRAAASSYERASGRAHRALLRVRRAQLLPLRALSPLLGRSRRDVGQPRVLAHLPTFLPEHRAGSEVSMAATLLALQDHGCDVSVIVDEPGASGEVDGLQVVRCPSWRSTIGLYRRADAVVTQLGSRNRATRWSALVGRPLVLFLRMGDIDPGTLLGKPDLVVFNAAWIRAQTRWTGPATVLHPPIDPGQFRTDPGKAITLVNLSERKGAPVLLELARRSPDLEFVGVRGSWGAQFEFEPLPNLTVLDPVEDMRTVYGQTRVLLMPSSEEPFGRVGVEAGCSGIPTVATPLPGIREALGDSALYANREDLDTWERHVRALSIDDRLWNEHSRLASERAEHWSGSDELSDLACRIGALVHARRQG